MREEKRWGKMLLGIAVVVMGMMTVGCKEGLLKSKGPTEAENLKAQAEAAIVRADLVVFELQDAIDKAHGTEAERQTLINQVMDISQSVSLLSQRLDQVQVRPSLTGEAVKEIIKEEAAGGPVIPTEDRIRAIIAEEEAKKPQSAEGEAGCTCQCDDTLKQVMTNIDALNERIAALEIKPGMTAAEVVEKLNKMGFKANAPKGVSPPSSETPPTTATDRDECYEVAPGQWICPKKAAAARAQILPQVQYQNVPVNAQKRRLLNW